jgi:EAL domain-containing protein (putative c-di-GMP-specific phosphodiesterase class I)
VLPPDNFIPVAEETGLIVPIGRWVLKTACAQNMAWQSQELSAISVAVNLSPRHSWMNICSKTLTRYLQRNDS